MLLVFDLEITVKECGFVITIFHIYSKGKLKGVYLTCPNFKACLKLQETFLSNWSALLAYSLSEVQFYCYWDSTAIELKISNSVIMLWFFFSRNAFQQIILLLKQSFKGFVSELDKTVSIGNIPEISRKSWSKASEDLQNEV